MTDEMKVEQVKGTPPTPRKQSELEILIRARYPLIYVVSWEEERVERCLREIAEKREKNLYVWTVTQGIVKSALIARWSGAPSRIGLASPWRRERLAGLAYTRTVPGSSSSVRKGSPKVPGMLRIPASPRRIGS